MVSSTMPSATHTSSSNNSINAVNYTPPPTVRDFIADLSPSSLFYSWILGPVGSGKTTGILFKLAYMASLQAKSPRDGIRRSRAVVVRNTFPQLRDTTIPSFNYWFKDGQAGTWKATQNIFILKFGDVECEVLFRALDSADDVARVLSLEVTFAILDEFVQIKQEIVEALSARCGRYPPKIDGGATNWGMWGSSNTGDEDSWWYQYLIDPPSGKLPKNVRLFVQPSGFSSHAENIENLPGEREYYTNQQEGKSDEWISQFINVQWGYSLDGQPVFPMFKRDIHVAKNPLMPNPHLPLVIGFDPGIGGSALILGQEDHHGRLLIYDELIQRDMGAKRIISERLMPLLRSKYPNFKVIIAPDPASASRTQTDEKSVVDEFRRHFEVAYDTNNTLTPRIEAMEHYMTRLTDAGPALLIDPGCRVTIRAYGGGYRYAISAKGSTGASPDKNEYSHPADAGMYLAKYYRKISDKMLKKKQSNFVPPRFDNRYTLR
jgi:hypothetical protein